MPIDALLGHSARLAVVSLHLPFLVDQRRFAATTDFANRRIAATDVNHGVA